MPTVLIDADGCPVVDLTVRLCHSRGIPVLIFCDTAHRIEREGAQTLVFDKTLPWSTACALVTSW